MNRSLKIVLKSQYLHELYLIKAKLENEDIISYINDEHINLTIGPTFVDQYKLLVDISDLKKAQAILKENNQLFKK